MTTNERKLIEEFKRIKNENWLKTVQKSWGGVGLTFEKALNKKFDSLIFPDYGDIEIKCTTNHSDYPIFLFTCAFDGPTFPEINRLIEKYGWNDKLYKNKKVLFVNLNCFCWSKLYESGYKFKFFINRKEGKMFLLVYDKDGNLVDDSSFVYLDSIKLHYELKMKKMAYIMAMTKKIKGENYFKYYRMLLFNSVSFEKFLNFIDKGIIEMSIIARMNKSGVDKGRYRNKNIEFKIRKDKLFKVFNCYYDSDIDDSLLCML